MWAEALAVLVSSSMLGPWEHGNFSDLLQSLATVLKRTDDPDVAEDKQMSAAPVWCQAARRFSGTCLELRSVMWSSE